MLLFGVLLFSFVISALATDEGFTACLNSTQVELSIYNVEYQLCGLNTTINATKQLEYSSDWIMIGSKCNNESEPLSGYLCSALDSGYFTVSDNTVTERLDVEGYEYQSFNCVVTDVDVTITLNHFMLNALLENTTAEYYIASGYDLLTSEEFANLPIRHLSNLTIVY